MTQKELNRAVAQATGESVAMISSMGFVPLMYAPPERKPQAIDWDEAEQIRRISLQSRRKRSAFSA